MEQPILKKVSHILENIGVIKIIGDVETSISSIHSDSREVKENSLFVAVVGTQSNGNEFIASAIQKGAHVIVHEEEQEHYVPNVIYVHVKDSHEALGVIAQNFYDNPSKKIKLVGVTGTNGKTTTATLLFNLFRLHGYNVALLSTIENKINETVFPTTHTTPDPISLASFLSKALSHGCTHAFMECSSHAIEQKRIAGLYFTGAIFTNLTHDHLDYHKTFEAYAEAKKKLFDSLDTSAFAIANKDDERAEYMLKDTRARKYFFSLDSTKHVDFLGNIRSQSLHGLEISINNKNLSVKMIGTFNAYNVLGVYGVALQLGMSEKEIISYLSCLTPPHGRLEFIISPNGIYGIVDYAHTPDALTNALTTLREIKQQESKIISVVGCGGDRDPSKRSSMGKIAVALSDFVVFTSDNPRNEDPELILKDIVKDLEPSQKKYECVLDRKKAIVSACAHALPGDTVLIAGKGHESYQILKNETIHFSDFEELEENFKQKI